MRNDGCPIRHVWNSNKYRGTLGHVPESRPSSVGIYNIGNSLSSFIFLRKKKKRNEWDSFELPWMIHGHDNYRPSTARDSLSLSSVSGFQPSGLAHTHTHTHKRINKKIFFSFFLFFLFYFKRLYMCRNIKSLHYIMMIFFCPTTTMGRPQVDEKGQNKKVWCVLGCFLFCFFLFWKRASGGKWIAVASYYSRATMTTISAQPAAGKKVEQEGKKKNI